MEELLDGFKTTQQPFLHRGVGSWKRSNWLIPYMIGSVTWMVNFTGIDQITLRLFTFLLFKSPNTDYVSIGTVEEINLDSSISFTNPKDLTTSLRWYLIYNPDLLFVTFK